MSVDRKAVRRRILDPIERYSEILFGLIMALTFTCSISAATAANIVDSFISDNAILGNTSGAVSDNGTRTVQGINKQSTTTTYVYPTGFQTSPLVANHLYNDMFPRGGARLRYASNPPPRHRR